MRMKMQRTKRTKKTERQLVKSQLDKEVRRIVLERDGKCVVCGSYSNLQCGHLHSRVALSTRWDFENCYCQCRNCNMRHEYDPVPLHEYARTLLGRRKYKALYQRYCTPQKWSIAELRERLRSLEGVSHGNEGKDGT